MGGSPLPTVAKIKNMVYMNNSADEESGINPREEYLGKCVCHDSAVPSINNQQCTCPKTLLSNRARYISFADIYIFGIGAEIYDSDLKPLTAGTGGNHFFKMKDITNLQKTFDDIIGMTSSCLSSYFILQEE